jgi:DNA processing protein
MNKAQKADLLRLLMVPKVGHRILRQLLAHYGDPTAIVRAAPQELKRLPGIGPQLAYALSQSEALASKVSQELAFAEKHSLRLLALGEAAYPRRLSDLEDAPILLFAKGNTDFNHARMLAVVGTRKPTAYGRAKTEEVVAGLAAFEPIVVSGLAYGIDYLAHQAALEHQLLTVAVLGHGLDQIYPHQHTSLARRMLRAEGALMTEYPSGTKPDRAHFPSRNRIVAGMVDGVLVVESGREGGALITAQIADSYQRDVLTFPGRSIDEHSAGCNWLIKQHKAVLVESAEEVAYHLGWDRQQDHRQAVARETLEQLPAEEREAFRYLEQHGKAHWDALVDFLPYSPSQLAMTLLNLEFRGLIDSLPGKYYALKGRG